MAPINQLGDPRCPGPLHLKQATIPSFILLAFPFIHQAGAFSQSDLQCCTHIHLHWYVSSLGIKPLMLVALPAVQEKPSLFLYSFFIPSIHPIISPSIHLRIPPSLSLVCLWALHAGAKPGLQQELHHWRSGTLSLSCPHYLLSVLYHSPSFFNSLPSLYPLAYICMFCHLIFRSLPFVSPPSLSPSLPLSLTLFLSFSPSLRSSPLHPLGCLT